MKRKLFTLFLLLTMFFAIGCNKKNKNPDPTPTPAPTATPTPVPVNLAKENLKKLVDSYDSMLEKQPNNQVDFRKGVGYDITLDLSIGQQILSMLGITDLNSVSLSGTMDMKDNLAANLSLYLNSSEVVNAHAIMDANNLLFTLPKYASNYASLALDEMLETEGDTISGNIGSLTKNLNPANAAALSEEMTNMIRSRLTDLVNCFKEVEGVTGNVSIGTGDYTMTGDRHTVSANAKDVLAVIKAFEADMENYYGELNLDLSDLEDSEATTLFLDYYKDKNGGYAWAFRTDSATDKTITFVNTDLGFCLYKTENGSETLGMTSEKSSEKSGVIYLYFNDEELAEGELPEPMGTIDYEYEENSLHTEIEIDTIEATVDYSMKNDIINYDVTLVVEGLSFVIKEKVAKEHMEMSMTLASFGLEYATIDMDLTLRDYAETPVPANTVDLETWAAGLDQLSLLNDLTALMNEYPFLALLFNMSENEDGYDEWEGEEWSDGDETQREEPFVLPADYHDDFMNMTGWTVDAEGYVDFEPLESEVLAAGKPSTGYDMLAITEDQKQSLFILAETAIKNYEKTSYTSYWVWGSAEYQDVQSYYSVSYEFADPDNWDNYITYTFDALSGDFIGVDIYNSSKDEALRIANEAFKTLGGTYAITDTMAEESTYDSDAGFSFFGYDGSPYGSNYYNVSFSVYSDN